MPTLTITLVYEPESGTWQMFECRPLSSSMQRGLETESLVKYLPSLMRLAASGADGWKLESRDK